MAVQTAAVVTRRSRDRWDNAIGYDGRMPGWMHIVT